MLANLMSKMSVLPFCLTATGHLDYLGKDLPLIPGKKNGNTTLTHTKQSFQAGHTHWGLLGSIIQKKKKEAYMNSSFIYLGLFKT